MFLSDASKLELSETMQELGDCLQTLRNLCEVRGWLMWQILPKSHYAMHLPWQSCLINSRYTQCYTSESLIGRITRIWHSAAIGRYHEVVQFTVCMKYLTFLHMTSSLVFLSSLNLLRLTFSFLVILPTITSFSLLYQLDLLLKMPSSSNKSVLFSS